VVDFKKRLSGQKAEKPTDPVALYETLDRAHDKGPLRPAQVAVLTEWFTNHQANRDVIVKLHTGQGVGCCVPEFVCVPILATV
jgi:hypothetical protein